MNQLILKIGEQTSIEDISVWPPPIGRRLVFIFTRTSSFEAAAEGVALSYLAGAIGEETDIELHCEFSTPTQPAEFINSVLCSIFGFTLIRSSKNIKFSDNKESNQKFREFAGRFYDEQKGVVGLGDRVSLIAFDPKRRVPRSLLSRAQTTDHDGFPLPSAFNADMLRILAGMGLPEVGSQTTFPILISFLYELFINTIQHGLPKNAATLIQSTRGIVLTKLAFNTHQLGNRKLSKSLKEYLLRIAESEKRETNLFVVCISVMDMGAGIQNTLPDTPNDEDPRRRLMRAFEIGETRKGTSSVGRGIGLHKVVQAAFRLGARLQVSSAGKGLIKDFSLGEDTLPTMQNAFEFELASHFSAGTSVDMFVPRLLTNVDQRKLGL